MLGLENLPALFFVVNDRRMERLDGTWWRPNLRCSSPPTHTGCFLGAFSLRRPPKLGSALGAHRCSPAARGELLPLFAEVVPVPCAPSVRHGDGMGMGTGPRR